VTAATGARVALCLALCVAPAHAQTLDRGPLHATFAEDFRHFAASATGFVHGRPAWRTTFIGGERTLANNHETEWYADPAPDGPFGACEGGLAITAGPRPGLPNGLTHRSGLITSQRLLAQRYGYFEIRARLPRGRGLWPAFWLLPSDGTWPPEIDVMEMLGDMPERYTVALHARPEGRAQDVVTAIPAPDLTAGFHVFGLAWQADRLRFYLDDRLVHESATPADMHRPMYLLANLAVGGAGSWPGQAAAGLSGVFCIAWIRAWQFGPP
jgi:beta-glucanase (GH16 family)